MTATPYDALAPPTDPTNSRICRNEYFILAQIYARTGILIHGLSILPVIIVRPCYRFGRKPRRLLCIPIA